MPDPNNTDSVSDPPPSWDSSQLSQRAWLDDLLPWLPTCNSSYAPLVEHGYTLTPQGRVVVYSMQHAQAVFFNLHTPYTMDSPSPVAPTFSFPTLPAPASAAGPTTRSGGAAPGAAPATSGGQPPAAAPVSAVRPLSADE
eukprot:4903836-Pleurochrysis_carterae.AAC.1